MSSCGAPSAPAASTPKPTSEAPANGGEGETEQAKEPAEPEPKVPRAKIVEVLPGKESAADRRVTITFDNPTASTCTFTSYTLVWSGGRKTIEEKPFEIPSGGKRQRKLIVHPNDGDLTKLKVEGSEIEVNAGCANVP